jgi:hypothetical protein
VAAADKRLPKPKTGHPRDHVKKMLEAHCPYHKTLVKHAMKHCNLMKTLVGRTSRRTQPTLVPPRTSSTTISLRKMSLS